MDYKYITSCRVCGSNKLKKYLDLGKQPLANALLKTKDSKCKKYPLQVLFCEDCYLSQLSIVVDPKVLYSDYPYHSSVSDTFKKHCLDMAKSLRNVLGPKNPRSSCYSVLDIASNDGCLLEQFKNEGYAVCGVEPCKELVEISRSKGIATGHGFWSERIDLGVGDFDAITATNVFAHVHDLKDFMRGVKRYLVRHGVFVLEVPYLNNLISQNQFDTIYHEHLSYFLLQPLKILLKDMNCPIFRVEEHPIHGGSLRVYASPSDRKEENSVSKFIKKEKQLGLHTFKTYKNYSKNVNSIKEHMVSLLDDLKQRGKKVVGYGASAKGIMLMNYCGIDSTQISSVVDDTKEKQGRIIPGCGIPVVSGDHFDTNHPDYIALLSWNFSDELKSKTKHLKAKYITPIPRVTIS